MPKDNTVLYSDEFYRCPYCRFVTYSSSSSLLENTPCSECRRPLKSWERLEVIVILSVLRERRESPIVPPV